MVREREQKIILFLLALILIGIFKPPDSIHCSSSFRMKKIASP